MIPQKWKAFFAMTVDVANQGPTIAGSAFRAHLDMAIKQNATREEVEELLLFLCCYCGFNKVDAEHRALDRRWMDTGGHFYGLPHSASGSAAHGPLTGDARAKVRRILD
jgi:alkylhydroperoxidase/carboxymuconolactone decarboxylase family protein YurZ